MTRYFEKESGERLKLEESVYKKMQLLDMIDYLIRADKVTVVRFRKNLFSIT